MVEEIEDHAHVELDDGASEEKGHFRLATHSSDHRSDGAREDAPVRVNVTRWRESSQTPGSPEHGVGLPRSSLAIGEEGAVVSSQEGVHHIWQYPFEGALLSYFGAYHQIRVLEFLNSRHVAHSDLLFIPIRYVLVTWDLSLSMGPFGLQRTDSDE